MKIVDENKGFHPITITIETQEEADVLAAVLGRLSGEDPKGSLYRLYCVLDRDDREYKGVGSLYVRKKSEEF